MVRQPIRAVPLDALCPVDEGGCGKGWMQRSNQNSAQKRVGKFNWHFQETCDRCGFTRRAYRAYMGLTE